MVKYSEIKKIGKTWVVSEMENGRAVVTHSSPVKKVLVEFVNVSKKKQLCSVFEKLSDDRKKSIESKADFADEIYTIGFEKDYRDFSEFVDDYATQLHEVFEELGYKQPIAVDWD